MTYKAEVIEKFMKEVSNRDNDIEELKQQQLTAEKYLEAICASLEGKLTETHNKVLEEEIRKLKQKLTLEELKKDYLRTVHEVSKTTLTKEKLAEMKHEIKDSEEVIQALNIQLHHLTEMNTEDSVVELRGVCFGKSRGV